MARVTRRIVHASPLLFPRQYRVWSVRYNHFHDQLVLSAGSDSHVVLHNVVSLSSDPYGQLHGGQGDRDSGDEGVAEEGGEEHDEDADMYVGGLWLLCCAVVKRLGERQRKFC